MTVRTPPSFLAASSPGRGRAPHAPRPVRLAAGSSRTGDLAVTRTARPNMSVNVADGRLVLPAQATYQRVYVCENRGTLNVAIAAADSRTRAVTSSSRGSRRQYSGATNSFAIGPSPAPRSVAGRPGGAGELVGPRRVQVAAGATTITNRGAHRSAHGEHVAVRPRRRARRAGGVQLVVPAAARRRPTGLRPTPSGSPSPTAPTGSFRPLGETRPHHPHQQLRSVRDQRHLLRHGHRDAAARTARSGCGSAVYSPVRPADRVAGCGHERRNDSQPGVPLLEQPGDQRRHVLRRPVQLRRAGRSPTRSRRSPTRQPPPSPPPAPPTATSPSTTKARRDRLAAPLRTAQRQRRHRRRNCRAPAWSTRRPSTASAAGPPPSPRPRPARLPIPQRPAGQPIARGHRHHQPEPRRCPRRVWFRTDGVLQFPGILWTARANLETNTSTSPAKGSAPTSSGAPSTPPPSTTPTSSTSPRPPHRRPGRPERQHRRRPQPRRRLHRRQPPAHLAALRTPERRPGHRTTRRRRRRVRLALPTAWDSFLPPSPSNPPTRPKADAQPTSSKSAPTAPCCPTAGRHHRRQRGPCQRRRRRRRRPPRHRPERRPPRPYPILENGHRPQRRPDPGRPRSARPPPPRPRRRPDPPRAKPPFPTPNRCSAATKSATRSPSAPTTAGSSSTTGCGSST